MSDQLAKPRHRLVVGIVLGIVVLLGLGSRRFGDQLPQFVSANAGDALWTMAVYLTIATAAPRWSPLKLGLMALGISLAVEVSQLWEAPLLNAMRDTTPGRLLLGSGFLWIDMIRYFAGALIATTLDYWLVARTR